MKDGMKGNATNDENNLQADTLTDLPVAEEQAREAKGGASGGHVKVFDGGLG